MIKFPFQKLLVYIAVISRFDSQKFAELRNLYLPSIKFDHIDPLYYVQLELNKIVVPASILNGKYDKQTFNLFLKQQNLTTLHLSLENPDFLDLVFDSDLRAKMDGMAMSPIFRRIDIVKEFITISPAFIDLYLDCFAQYNKLESINQYVEFFIGDVKFQNRYKQLLSSSSRQYCKVLLKLRNVDVIPKNVYERAASIADMMLDNALDERDSKEAKDWLKLSLIVADKVQKVGAGTRGDINDLLETLQQEKDFLEPTIYTMEELNEASL